MIFDTFFFVAKLTCCRLLLLANLSSKIFCYKLFVCFCCCYCCICVCSSFGCILFALVETWDLDFFAVLFGWFGSDLIIRLIFPIMNTFPWNSECWNEPDAVVTFSFFLFCKNQYNFGSFFVSFVCNMSCSQPNRTQHFNHTCHYKFL